MISLKKTQQNQNLQKHARTKKPLSERLKKRQPVQTLFLCQPS